MKQIFRKNKLILSFLVALSPLTAGISIKTQIIIKLLKKTDSALEDWSKLQHKWIWSGKASQAKISLHSQELKKLQEELATALYQFYSSTILTDQYRKIDLKGYESDIANHAPPSHLRQNWTHYSAAAVGLVGGAYLLSRYGYDDEGKHIAKNFYTHHIKEPITNMIGILTNKNADLMVLEQDANDASRRFQNKLDLFIENAKQDAQLSQIVINHIPQNIPIEEVSLKNKLAFLDASLTFMHTHIPEETIDSLKTFKVWNWGNIPHLSSALDSHILLLQQLRVEKMLATNKIEKVSQKVDLTIELIAAIPALVASYFCFKSLGKYWTRYKVHSTYKPLKKMLIKLQLQYNKDRYLETASPVTQGMNIYWISQLKEASSSIPMTERTTYNQYLEQLEDQALRPDQKITLIENMLRDISCLQKV